MISGLEYIEKFVRYDLPPTRLFRLASLLKKLHGCGLIPKTRLRLTFERERAYMTDDGGLYLNAWLVGFVGAGAFAAALLHELAHLCLIERGSYKHLLALDFGFTRANEGNKNAILVSPVELYATHVACRACRALLGRIEGCKAHAPLAASVKDREDKLKEVIPTYLV